MKQRQGFVSNSSSSSFVCIISHEAEELFDDGGTPDLEDREGFCHTRYGDIRMRYFIDFVKSQGLKADWKKYWDCPGNCSDEDAEKHYEQIDKYYDEGLPDQFCPLFNLYVVPDKDILAEALRQLGLKRSEFMESIRKTYKNLDELRKATKGLLDK